MGVPKNPFLKAGEFLVDKIGLERIGKKDRGLRQELVALAVGDKDAVRQYYVKKTADTLLILMVLMITSLLVFLAAGDGSSIVENSELERPGYGMGSREEELAVQIDGEKETEVLSVAVQEQKLTAQQADELLEQGKAYLEEHLIGENVSPDQVREALCFPVSLENGLVTVSWMTVPYGMIGEDGSITGKPEEEGSIVEIQAALSCQGRELIYETAVCVYPPDLSEEERLWKSVQNAVEQADEDSAEQEMMKLPREVEGKKITWIRQSESLLSLFLALTVILPVCVFLQKDQKVHQKAMERKAQLRMDYPELLWKMTMLLGAGLTIRGAFGKIAAEYKREHSGEMRYAYEEMLRACYEMKSGVAESIAYENFGRRCGLPGYIKFGSLLSQNLKKGSKGLASLLEKEAVSSMEERKNMARKLGEQAGTKLLFPMILMFGIVLIILIVPAFLSF